MRVFCNYCFDVYWHSIDMSGSDWSDGGRAERGRREVLIRRISFVSVQTSARKWDLSECPTVAT